jgi:hypothetical protein
MVPRSRNRYNSITNKTNFTQQTPPHKLTPTNTRVAPADSGASGIYISNEDSDLLANTSIDQQSDVTQVQAAEGTVMHSKASGSLRFHGMPDIDFPAKVFDELDSSLIGVGTSIDKAKVKAVLSSDSIDFINQDGTIVLSGPRCRRSGLWNIDLNQSVVNPCAHALAVRPLPMDSVGDLIEWWHASFCYPAASTFLRALSSWLKDKIPGVTLENARKYKNRLQSITSAKGHLNQTRQRARSTRDIVPVPRQRKTGHNILVHMLTAEERNDMDIAHLLVDKYLMFFYSSGGNYIHIELLDSRTENHVLSAYKKGVEFFSEKGLKPNVQRMDNEPSFLTAAFRAYQEANDITPDLVPPGQHRRNKAERAIETGKHHIIAALAGADPSFPMKGVKHTMWQIELTLNLLRQSRRNPSMSAWELLHGPYNFNAWPLGPLGCRILCHEKPDD